MKKIILKSSSPRRKEILESLGLDFIIKAYDVDEALDPKATPEENVQRLGYLKATVNKELYPDYIQIGCDTIVVLDGIIYGKPKDEEDAFRMLRTFSGKKHQVMSGLTVVYDDIILSDVVISDVYFKELTDEEINDYIKTKEPFGKAGAYAIQGIGKALVSKYEGSLTNIIGLPKELLIEFLNDLA